MSLKFSVGDLTIHRIIEQETTVPAGAGDACRTLTPELLAENRGWMQEAKALDDNDVLILCFQSYVVKTPHHTILIDSCIGNDKPRPQRPKWNMKTDDTYMRALAGRRLLGRRHRLRDVHASACRSCRLEHAAGERPLGADLPQGALRLRQERVRLLDRAERQDAEVPPFADSVLPVVEAKRHELVGNDFAIGDHVRILPTPGHTPGHVAFTLRPRQGRCRVLRAISCTRRCRRAIPNCRSKFDVDPKQAAAKTRRSFLERYCDTDTLCCTAHFPSPSVGQDQAQGQRVLLRDGVTVSETHDFATLSIESVDEHVTVVRLNRPDASNALNTQMGRDLVRCFEDVALDPKSLRCIVLTGAGDKAFCAGGDLKERRGMTDEAWARQHVIFERMVRALIDCPVPIIGAINGAAYGGGCEIAGCCDFLYAAEA